MSKVKVDEISNTLDNGPVYFPYGVTGDGSRMTLKPGITTLAPNQLATNVGLSTAIQIGFNQNMQFLGVGTITVRQGSATGSIHESFTCGVSAGATITNNLLTLNLSTALTVDTTYFVTLPSTGIANTLGATIEEVNNYQFNTVPSDFDAQGGNDVFTLSDSGSPTGFYKYHVFSGPGILTTTAPSNNAVNLSMMMIAGGGSGGTGTNSPTQSPPSSGGGGAGGYIVHTESDWNLAAGTYTFTRGAGGAAPPNNSMPEASLPQYQGENSTLVGPTYTLTALGGGWGGSTYRETPSDPKTQGFGNPGGSGGGGGSNGGPTTNWCQKGLGTSGQGNDGAQGTSSNYSPTNVSTPISPKQETRNAGGGGGAGEAGAEAIYYYAPPNQTAVGPPGAPRYNARFGKGGNGARNPAFTAPVLSPRVTSIPTDTFLTLGPTGDYWAGGGSGGGGGQTAGQIGGYGGGGRTKGPWFEGNSGFGQPLIPEPSIPGTGATNTGGGGGGGYPSGAPYYGGAGGPGVMMIRYAHPGS